MDYYHFNYITKLEKNKRKNPFVIFMVLCVCVLDYFQLKVFKVQSFWIYFEEIICDFKCLTSKFISMVCVLGLVE